MSDGHRDVLGYTYTDRLAKVDPALVELEGKESPKSPVAVDRGDRVAGPPPARRRF